jgi:Sec-independent protein translocase protein TatA
MDAGEAGGAEHVIATYREIAAHFGLKGTVQARVKAKRAGWDAEPQNHPADPLRIRVPRDAWNRGVHGRVSRLPRPTLLPRNPSPPTPDLKDEIGGIIKGFETALDTLRQQLDRERERAERAEAEREVARIGRAAAEAEVRVVREQAQQAQTDRAEATARAVVAEAGRDAARAELAEWTAGSPLARAWRALVYRRGRG